MEKIKDIKKTSIRIVDYLISNKYIIALENDFYISAVIEEEMLKLIKNK